MRLTVYEQVEPFLHRVRDELEQQEVRNCLLLGIALRLQSHPESVSRQPHLATIEDGSKLVATALMTPPHNLVLASADPGDEEAWELLARHWQAEGWPMPGVLGPSQVALSFAQTWQRLTGQPYRESKPERVFELTQVIAPRPGPGHLRTATLDDLELVLTWVQAFTEEALPDAPEEDAEETRQLWVRRIEQGSVHLWVLEDGEIVSLAVQNRPVSTVISIGPVYTPPEQRGKGYASRCVAMLSQLLLDKGWRRCSLFTDLTNPISNSIYQKIGYRAVCDFNKYLFR
jgi:predicted GNAT family acetyltransferase